MNHHLRHGLGSSGSGCNGNYSEQMQQHPTFQPASYYNQNQYHHHHHHHQLDDDHDKLFASRHLQEVLGVGGTSKTSLFQAKPTSPVCSSVSSCVSPILCRDQLAGSSGQTTSLTTTRKSKVKKARTMFSNYQLTMLETTFQQSPYPDAYIRRGLATRLGLDVARVQVWFQNRRAKWRKKAAARAQQQQHPQQQQPPPPPQQTSVLDHSSIDLMNLMA